MRTKLNSNGLKNLISRIVRESINEKMVDRFTPYTDKDREENFTPFTSKDTRTSFQRNPSYEKALKDAEERRKKKQAGITEEGFDRIVRESIKKEVRRALRENENVDAESLCYGREDLMRVAESIANELGNIDIAEDLCDKMASAAVMFVKHLQNGGTFSVTPY